MIPSFKLIFYKGDTPSLVVHLDVAGISQDLSQMSAQLLIQGHTIQGTVSGTKAVFFITKEISQQLQLGVFKAWIEFIQQNTKYSYQGVVKIMKGYDPDDSESATWPQE